MRIVLVPNRRAAETLALANAVFQRLAALGVTVEMTGEEEALPASSAIAAALEGADAAIAIGGDGTIMHVAKAAAVVRCPVLGINGGHLGFLAGVEPDELAALDALATGTYTVEERMLLRVAIYKEDQLLEFLAMNEAVISRGALSRLVDVAIMADAADVLTCRGDGVIVATPTGSTAYSLSAGGPVVHPAVDGLLLTPVCPHSLDSRARLLPADTVLTVRAQAADEGMAFISVDGEEYSALTAADRVTIQRAEVSAHLIRLKAATFYDVLQEKLAGRR